MIRNYIPSQEKYNLHMKKFMNDPRLDKKSRPWQAQRFFLSFFRMGNRDKQVEHHLSFAFSWI
jgi:hypothetical protein